MVQTTCPRCGNVFTVKAYRLKTERKPFCSYICSAAARVERGDFKVENPQAVSEAETLYKAGVKPCDIAKKIGFSRSAVFRWANKYKWSADREAHSSTRNKYRKAAERLIGRRLIRYEHVHHIDGDNTNNDDNLHVFPDARSHALAHASLQDCAFELLKQGAIRFDRQAGIYYLDGEIE